MKVFQRENLKFKPAFEFSDHFFPVNDIDFAETRPWMATCANDTIANLFDVEKGQLCRTFLGGHTSFVTKCKFNSQENLLVTVGADNFLFLWDIR